MVMLARLKRCELLFHHHSFSYLRKRSVIMSAIAYVAGPRQQHVALCPTMSNKLCELYGERLMTTVVSNLAFFDLLPSKRSEPRQALCAVGYLSNISLEKGIDRFLDLMAELRASGSQLKGRIAGPFVSLEVQDYVLRRTLEIGGIEYVGPVFGDTKDQFLSSIDLLVFPTRYPHEAQPLVIYEAQAAGVVVAASGRGCIPSMVPNELLLDATASDLRKIVEQILTWEKTPGEFLRVSNEGQRRRMELADRRLTDASRFRELFAPEISREVESASRKNDRVPQ
jgi:glycosyltransferase involved in cell wall biosynthesis